MAAALIPRLSHVLRVLMSEQTPADTDRDRLVRRDKVNAHQAKTQASEDAAHTLTWKSFVAEKANNFASTSELKPVRSKFNKFFLDKQAVQDCPTITLRHSLCAHKGSMPYCHINMDPFHPCTVDSSFSCKTG